MTLKHDQSDSGPAFAASSASPATLGRRAFLKLAGGALALPAIIPSVARGGDAAPSRRITIGCIGVGRMGSLDLRELLGYDQVQIVAVCDVDEFRRQSAKQAVETHYAERARAGRYQGCSMYLDYRELLARADIDAVTVVTADHWHALIAIDAARAGKDIFVQKPMTWSVAEGRALSDAVRRYGRVLQVGSQQRSGAQFRRACELVRNGRIGRLKTVRIGLPVDPAGPLELAMPVPPELDYERWVGPAPFSPYSVNRVHPRHDLNGRPGWMRVSLYCNGTISNWGTHHVDIAHWGMDTEHTGPVAVSGRGEFPREGIWDVHGAFHLEMMYANGVRMIVTDEQAQRQGIRFEGEAGWIFVSREAFEASSDSLRTSAIGANEIRLYESNDHKGNWLECIRTRSEPVAPVEIGHRSNTACLVGLIAMQLGRPLQWDPAAERFVNDEGANRLLRRPCRAPWVV